MMMTLVQIGLNISFINQVNLDANLSAINVNNATAATEMPVYIFAMINGQIPAFVRGSDFQLKIYLNTFQLF